MMRRKCRQFINCSVLRNHNIVREDLWICDGKVIDPSKYFEQTNEKVVIDALKCDDWRADEIVDCHGAIIAPGFIDLQINGGFGFDFTSDIVDEESAEKVLGIVGKGLLSHGVTSYCPTIVTSPPQVFQKILPCIRKTPGGSQGAGVLGVHVEGPFISVEKRGAHSVQHLKVAADGWNTVSEVYGPGLENVSIMTIAPELDGAIAVIEECRERGIKVSVGHTMAGMEEGVEAVEKGATLVTHLFNGMKSFHHRDPGLLGLFLKEEMEEDKVWFGVIADGVHAHPLSVKLAYKVNFTSLVLVTDAICAMGFKDGRYRSGQQDIEVVGPKALVAGTDILIGSVATMHGSVLNLKNFTGCSLAEALEAASLHPAKALGVEGSKGMLEHGKDADIVFIHRQTLQLLSTWIGGEKVYEYQGEG